jgi:hypothetical protein
VGPGPECGDRILVPVPEETVPAEPADALDESGATTGEETPPSAPEQAPEAERAPAVAYRVFSVVEGQGESGRITADTLQIMLNELSSEGWMLRSAVALQAYDADGTPKQEVMLIMERTVEGEGEA